jgi:hypothetical protein
LIISILGKEMIDPVDSMKRLSLRYSLMGEKINPQMIGYRSQKTFYDVISFNSLIFYISKFKVLRYNG